MTKKPAKKKLVAPKKPSVKKLERAFDVPKAAGDESRLKPKATRAPKSPAVPPPGPGEIAIRNGNETTMNVKAERVYDFFAVHDPTTGGSGRVLTHVPTGMSVGRYRTRAIAVWVAGQLRALGGEDVWQFTDAQHLAKHGDKALLAKMRQVTNPPLAEEMMKAQADTTPKPAGRVGVKPGWQITPPPTPAPNPSTAWRGQVDWVAAGKKAYETRMRNLAAKAAAVSPPLPSPAPAPKVKVLGRIPNRAPLVQPAPIAAPRRRAK